MLTQRLLRKINQDQCLAQCRSLKLQCMPQQIVNHEIQSFKEMEQSQNEY